MTDVSDLKFKVLKSIENKDNRELVFVTTNDERYLMWHPQDCCESVAIEEIIGDLEDLVGQVILMAEEVSNDPTFNEDSYDYFDDSHTWTFYKFATAKGYVTIRWLGQSNGYYSESVYFSKCNENDEPDYLY